jgi:hypothetical protein
MILKYGDVIPCALKLYDGATDKYVKATIRGDDGIEISGSPLSCAHLSAGLYQNYSLTMPSGTDFITIEYKVYTDSGFLTAATGYGDAMDSITLYTPTTLGTIIAGELSGVIVDEELNGFVDLETELYGQVSGEELIGQIGDC